jgi:hypothetical protein
MMWMLLLLLLQAGPDTRFRMATEALTAQDPVTASRELGALEREGYANGPLFVNLGIAYTQMDSLGLAKYYFTKASRYADVAEQSKTGLAFVNGQLLRRASGLPVLSLNQMLNRILWAYPARTVLLVPLVLLNLGIALLIWHWFVPAEWKAALSWACLVVSVIAFIVVASATAYRTQYGLGVVIQREGTLREEPSATAEAVLPVYEGYDVRIHRDATVDGWTKVTLINGSTGWLPSRGVRAY